jgi:hypothetical protein
MSSVRRQTFVSFTLMNLFLLVRVFKWDVYLLGMAPTKLFGGKSLLTRPRQNRPPLSTLDLITSQRSSQSRRPERVVQAKHCVIWYASSLIPLVLLGFRRHIS